MRTILILTLILSGCATNGVKVHEKTAEGYEFSMDQRTVSTWGSRTEEGAGSVDYTAKSPDGSSFDLKAGAGVTGQQAADPSGLVTAIMGALIQKSSEPAPEQLLHPP